MFVQENTQTYYVWLIDLSRPRCHRFRYFIFFFIFSLVILFSANWFCHCLSLSRGIAELTVWLTNQVLDSFSVSPSSWIFPILWNLSLKAFKIKEKSKQAFSKIIRKSQSKHYSVNRMMSSNWNQIDFQNAIWGQVL